MTDQPTSERQKPTCNGNRTGYHTCGLPIGGCQLPPEQGAISERHCIKCGNPERLHGPKPDPAVDDGFGGESWYHWHPFSPAPEQGVEPPERIWLQYCPDGSLDNRIWTKGDIEYVRATRSVPAEWQPIETAPKNGTKVWVYRSNGEQSSARWLKSSTGGDWWYGLSRLNPTHWMPLPLPPKEKD